MYELKVISTFAAAHQLREYEGECEKLHGHNWKIEVCVTGGILQPNGLLIDFNTIKAATRKVMSEFDHKFLNDLKPFQDINPSSENIAQYIFHRLSAIFRNEKVEISKVTAWESESACASYVEE